MRIQLDTTAKTITIDENVKLQDLFLLLEKILPKEEWKKFTLQTNVTISNWSSPIYVDRFIPYSLPNPNTYPWSYHYATTGSTINCSSLTGANSSTTSVIPQGATLTAGVFNIEG